MLQLAEPAYTSQEQPGSHALKLPLPSEALAKQLSHSQRSVPGSQLLTFVTALDDDNSLESAGDELHALAVNSYGFLAQAFCDVLGRQEEAYAHQELFTTSQKEGPGSIEELMIDVVNFVAMASTLAPSALDLVLGMENTLQAERLLSCLTLVLTAMLPQDLFLALAQRVAKSFPELEMKLARDHVAMGVALSKLQPEQVWTWQALAAGTPAEATLQGLLPALASLFQVQGLVTPIEPGWRHQRLTLAMGKWHLS
ncbi:hypothetical protein HaLaN_18286 [Haematococcus lacustris]|uniref:Uncharacterized protein n=1 Tax=Haematococcus lacustris TaxID=44745 RepID=A0A699ZGI2_HAELA|nr:hypothetical protein HaLaN_18286 [Haematococcus lacustris]